MMRYGTQKCRIVTLSIPASAIRRARPGGYRPGRGGRRRCASAANYPSVPRERASRTGTGGVVATRLYMFTLVFTWEQTLVKKNNGGNMKRFSNFLCGLSLVGLLTLAPAAHAAN